MLNEISRWWIHKDDSHKIFGERAKWQRNEPSTIVKYISFQRGVDRDNEDSDGCIHKHVHIYTYKLHAASVNRRVVVTLIG